MPDIGDVYSPVVRHEKYVLCPYTLKSLVSQVTGCRDRDRVACFYTYNSNDRYTIDGIDAWDVCDVIVM